MSESFQPISANEIGLSNEDAGHVASFLVSPVSARAALKVSAAELLGALTALPAAVVIVVFLDESPLAADDLSVRRMVKDFVKSGVQALIRPVAATDAVKRIQAGLVVESIDRNTLNPLRAPEVVDRRTLEQALGTVDGSQMVNPTELVASVGGVVRIIDS